MATNMSFSDGVTVVPADWLNFVNTVVNTPGGTGTVTTVSVATANGLAGTVATATTTPVITLRATPNGILKSNGTTMSAATAGTDYAVATTGSSVLKGNGLGGFSNAVTSDIMTLVGTPTLNGVVIGAGTSAVTTVAPGTSGNVLTSNGTTWASTAPAGGASIQALYVRREEPSGTNGGNITASTWTTLVLNTTVSNTITGASRSSSQVTLPAGTYVVNGWCPVGTVGAGRLRIQNITDATSALAGYNFVGGGTGYSALISGTFVLAATKVIEFQIWAPTAVGSSALGNASSIGAENEIFAGYTLTKIA